MSNGKTLLAFCLLAVVIAVAIHSASGATSTYPQGRAGLDGSCDNKTTNCSTGYSVCSATGKCVCEGGYEKNGTICVIKLDTKCNATRPCNRTGGECINGLCKCKSSYVVSSNQQNCLLAATALNGPCTEEQQCSKLGNSTCSQGACVCKNGYFQVSNTACGVSGNNCQSGSCSFMGYATCVNGNCQCIQGGVLHDSRCYRQLVGTVGGTCGEYDLCYLSADGQKQNVGCVKGKCTCNKKYKPNKTNTSCSGAASIFTSITVLLLAAVGALKA